MRMRRLILAPILLLTLALPAAAERIPLAELSNYLNSLSTVESKFTQVNADGTLSTGRVLINRPGRVRFEYDPPEKTVVMAGGGQVAIFDGKSNQPPEQYPLSRTPLNLILARNVDLSRSNMVVGHTSDDTVTTVTAQDPEHPEYGNIRLVFTDNPVELRQWVITDEAGGQTTVVLNDLTKGGSFGASLFNITLEAQKRGVN